ncbi:MAG TPA: TetR/AcrR family transcriptional regulator [Candidatus Limnocylindria bacterium]|nr:TetR/AcrR family transcriptional regulator [Candidatus Limnocylindria bacterium]
MQPASKTAEMPETKRKLVDAGVRLMRLKGFTATTVDDICEAAEVTKGAFFHYYKSKEDLAKAAITRFGENQFADSHAAPYRKLADPLQRVYGRLDYVKESSGGTRHLTKGCLVGTVAQELSFTHSALRSSCQDAFLRVAGDFEKDLAAAKSVHAPQADFDPKKLATLFVSIFQGSLIMAKASEDNTVLSDNLEQFRRYLQTLFGQNSKN